MKFLIYIILLSLPTYAISNNNVCLEIYGKVKSHRNTLKDVVIHIVKDGDLEKQITNSNSGKFSIDLEKGHNYEVVFKKQGYFSQFIEVNTKSNEIEDYVWDFYFLIDMLPTLNTYSSAIMNKPFVSIRYSLVENEFVKDINNEMLNIYNELTYNYKKDQVDKYTDIVRFADVAFQKGQLDAAQRLYEKAEILNPSNLHADIQMVMIERIKKIDTKNNKRYDELIIKADKLFETEELLKAKKLYAKALNYKEDDYPRHKMSTIKETITLKQVLSKSN